MPVCICSAICVSLFAFRNFFRLFFIHITNDILSYFLLTNMTICHIILLY